MTDVLWSWVGEIQPVPLERHRSRLVAGGVVSYLPTRSADFRALLQASWLAARTRPKEPFEGELELHIDFKGAAKRGARPDVSNLAKAVEDAMNGMVIRDDAQVRRLVAEIVRWGPGVDPSIAVSLRRYVDA